MRETINVQKRREGISLVTGVTYSNVVGWFGATRKDLKMDIMMPKEWNSHEPCPCLVWICGGAFMAVDRSVWIPEMEYLAEAGFVIASVEYRTTGEAQFPAPLIDVKAAVRFLRAHASEYCIDPDRIYAAGESAGGSLASLLGVTAGYEEYEQGDYLEQSSSVSKVVDFYGLVDICHEKFPIAEGLPMWILDAYLGDHYSMEKAAKASAITYVDENTPPFLLLHGDKDEVSPLSQSESFYAALQNKGIASDLYVIEGAVHGDSRFYQYEIMDIIIKFLKS